ncbi:MAG: hypothetical protein IPP77_05670 [Bacteroidetes bacterium]|nr:hypothetical protein [Bacteroidota bacterium]
MKIKTTGIVATAIFLLSIAACTKKEDSGYPNLSISSPTAAQMFSSGDTMYLKGTALASGTDDAHLLHEVMVAVKWQADSSVMFSANYSTHDLESFDFDTFFITPSVVTPTNAFVEAKAENHIPMVTTKTISVMIHP